MEPDKLKSPFYALITDAVRERVVNPGFPHPIKAEKYNLHVGELALFRPDVLSFYENLIDGVYYETSRHPLLSGTATVGLSCKDLSGKSIPFATCKYQRGDIPLVLHSMVERQAHPEGNGYVISMLRAWEFVPLRSQELEELLIDEIDLICTSRGIPDRYPDKDLEDTFRHLAAFPILMKSKIENVRVERAPKEITDKELKQEQEHEDRMQELEEYEAKKGMLLPRIIGAERF